MSRHQLNTAVHMVDGEEACKFLHAIVTSDVEALTLHSSQRSLILTPAGKVVAPIWISRVGENTYAIVCEEKIADVAISSLKRLLIRTKAEISQSDSHHVALATQESNGIVLEEKYCGSPYHLVLAEEPDVDDLDEMTHDALRITYGAVGSVDLKDNTIPQEAALTGDSVSFTKGCYLGQELVCRIDSREASTPFTFYALKSEQPVSVDDDILNGEDVIGHVTSVSNITFDTWDVGEFNAIARISRKGTAALAEQESYISIQHDGDKVSLTSIEPVSGNFRA